MKKMIESSISTHLIELRRRIIRIFSFFLIFASISIPFANEIYEFVAMPLISILPDSSSMIATQVSSPLMAPIKLTLFSSMLITMPYLFSELWFFMSPGLYKNEKKIVAPLLLSSTVLFLSGVLFSYFIVCPIIFKFFILSAPDSIIVMTDINSYLNFIFKLAFAFGISFEIPIATFLLIKSKVVTKSGLSRARPYLIIFFFTIGMLLTPPDIFSQLFLAIPMWILFEIGLLISREK